MPPLRGWVLAWRAIARPYPGASSNRREVLVGAKDAPLSDEDRSEVKGRVKSKSSHPSTSGKDGAPRGKATTTTTAFEAGPSLRFPSFRQGKRDDNEKLDGAPRCFFFCAVV